MKSKILIVVVSMITGIFGLYLIMGIFGLVLSIPSPLNPFYESCLDLSQGMEREEVEGRMQDFLSDSKYRVEEEGPGTYGWKGRLSYDNSLLIVLERDPWYKLDQHPWQCEIFFKSNLVVNIEPFFD